MLALDFIPLSSFLVVSSTMDKLSSLARFKASCPFLGRTQSNTLRSLSTSTSPRFSTLTQLTEKATECPVMGPALAKRTGQMVAGYASVAGNIDVNKFHQEKGVIINSNDVSMCPHASKALAAAKMAEELAQAKKLADAGKAAKTSSSASSSSAASSAKAAGCPFHAAAPAKAAPPVTKAPTPVTRLGGGFDYEKFYAAELQKKHDDSSYRYFNNINRLAAKFPVAHTANPKSEVEVWCANDYLGMGNNPIVLETMQYVSVSFFYPYFFVASFVANCCATVVLWISTVTVLEVLGTSPATVPGISTSRRSWPLFTASLLLWSSLPAMWRTMLPSPLSDPNSRVVSTSPTRPTTPR